MPREQITHNHIVDRSEPGDDVPIAEEIARRNVHIMWNQLGWVQMAVDITLGELRELLKYAEQEAEAAAKGNAHIGEYLIEGHPVKVVSSEIDRAEVNKTIKTLRRARDAAYGADE